jgi:phospholipid/cholesterol/gamma-HCH transport system substrate-binding protein
MASRSAARRRRAVLYGGLTFVFFIALVALSLVSQHGLPFAPRTEVKAAFSDIGSLRVGDDVRIANVRVGYVSSVDLSQLPNVNGQDKLAVTTLALDNQRPVYKSSSVVAAQVGARSGLGQKYVELDPGVPSSGLLGPNDVIPAARTEGAQEPSDLLMVLDLPTRQALGSMVRNVGGGLAGHGEDLHAAFTALPDILPDLSTVSTALSTNNGQDLASLLRSGNELSVSFRGRQQQIGQLLGKLDKTFAGLNADNGQALAATLDTAPDALRKTRAALLSLDGPLADTATATRVLLPGGVALGQATPDVRGVLVESKPPLDKVPGVSDDAQPALVDLRDTFDDAQPLTPMLGKTFGRGGAITQILSPYSPEASLFFTNATRALQNGNDRYHWLNVITKVDLGEDGTDAISAPIRNPLQQRDPRPPPGQSPKQVQGLPGPLNRNGVTGR